MEMDIPVHVHEDWWNKEMGFGVPFFRVFHTKRHYNVVTL